MSEDEIKFKAWCISGERWVFFTLEDLAKGALFNSLGNCHWDNYKDWQLIESEEIIT